MSSSATASIRVDSSDRLRRPVSASRPAFARRRRSWAANAASFSEGVASDESGTGAAGGGDGNGTSTRGAGGGDGGGTEQQLVRVLTLNGLLFQKLYRSRISLGV